MRHSLPLTALSLTLAAHAPAQSPILEVPGVTPFGNFGWAVAGGGDVTGDGVPDPIVGGYRDMLLGRVRVASGADGSIVHDLLGSGPGLDGLGANVAYLGDVNQDARDEFIAVSLWSGDATVFSGLDATPLFTVPGDWRNLTVLGDVTGDGLLDFAIVNAGAVDVRSGRDGTLFVSLAGQASGALGDVNGDTVLDFAVFDAGALSALSGATLAPLWTRPVGGAVHLLREAPDVDGDGTDDLLLALENTNGHGESTAVLSGADGSTLATFAHAEQTNSRLYSAGVGDVNRDQHGDVVVAGTLYSGRTGEVLCVFETSTFATSGFSAAAAGDVVGDGLPDILVGDPLALGVMGGGFVFRASGHLGASYCTSTQNSTGQFGTLAAVGSASVAADELTFVADGLPVNTFGLLFYGGGQTQVAVGNGIVCVASGGQGIHRYFPPGNSNPAGHYSQRLELALAQPGGAIVAGSTWNFQLWYRDTGAQPTNNYTVALELAFQ